MSWLQPLIISTVGIIKSSGLAEAFPMISLSSPFASYSSYGTQIVSERKSVR